MYWALTDIYEGNDRLGKLSMDGVAIETAQSQDYEVVTKVDMPLSGLSQYYYANGYLYVPAMSNLNGEISGIHFENGRFNVDMIITMYWDTLEKLADIPEQTGDSGQEAEPGQPGDVQDPGENDKGESGDQALENHGDGLTNVSKDAGGDHQEDLSEAVSRRRCFRSEDRRRDKRVRIRCSCNTGRRMRISSGCLETQTENLDKNRGISPGKNFSRENS